MPEPDGDKTPVREAMPSMEMHQATLAPARAALDVLWRDGSPVVRPETAHDTIAVGCGGSTPRRANGTLSAPDGRALACSVPRPEPSQARFVTLCGQPR